MWLMKINVSRRKQAEDLELFWILIDFGLGLWLGNGN